MNTCFMYEGILAYVNQESMKRSEDNFKVCHPRCVCN